MCNQREEKEGLDWPLQAPIQPVINVKHKTTFPCMLQPETSLTYLQHRKCSVLETPWVLFGLFTSMERSSVRAGLREKISFLVTVFIVTFANLQEGLTRPGYYMLPATSYNAILLAHIGDKRSKVDID